MAQVTVVSEVNGSVWKIVVKVGDSVSQDDPLLYVESMKMEIPVVAPESGVVTELMVTEGHSLSEGDPVALLRT